MSAGRLYSAPEPQAPQPVRGWGAAWPAYAAAAASGAMLGAAFPSLDWNGLAWVALAPLWIVVARATSGWRALWTGYVAGMVFFAVSCPWIATTIHRYGDLSPALAVFVFLLFLALMSSYFALFAGAGYWIGTGLNHRLLPLPFLWVAVELLRTYTPMGGFPWNLLGYSQYHHLGFMRLTAFTGVYGASLLIAMVNTSLAALLLHGYDSRSAARPWGDWSARPAFTIAAAAGAAAVLIFAALPFHPPPPLADSGQAGATPVLHARLVQPNTPLNADWTQPALDQFLQVQLQLSAPAGQPPVQLLVWPEQPAPLSYPLEPRFRQIAADIQARRHPGFLFGEVTYPWRDGAPDYARPRNSSLFLQPGGMVGPRYDKLHLVPFGEYVPLPAWLEHFAGIGKLVREVGDFVPGQRLQLFPLDGYRFATMICYESIFPEIARRNVAAGAEWLVNQSDDSWYGASSAAAQGLMMARVRAIENHRWLLRDTNNGITAVIDPNGRVTASLPRFQAAGLDAGFVPLTGLTFYTRHGDWLADLCAGIIGVLVLGAGLRSRKHHGA